MRMLFNYQDYQFLTGGHKNRGVIFVQFKTEQGKSVLCQGE